MKKILVFLVAIIVLGFIVVFGADYLTPAKPELADSAPADAGNKDLIAKGAYLARMGDCVACHSVPDGKPFAGGLAMATPMGTIYSSNITPDRQTGIGAYSLQAFARAVREGRLPDGTHLYPAMPYASYAKISDDDIRALYAYFMQGVGPVNLASKPAEMRFPFGIRKLMSVWNLAFYDASDFDDKASENAQIARGAYLTEGLAHCGACHTPRGFGQQEKGLTGKDPDFLTGASVEGWTAPALRAKDGPGVGTWSAQDIADLLLSGRSVHSGVTGPMTDVIANSTQYASREDAMAMAAYLKSLPSGATKDAAPKFVASDQTANDLRNGITRTLGARLYVDNCAACHRSSGSGEKSAFPALAGNPLVLADDPSSLIHVILAGATLPSTQAAPSDLGMPHFAGRMNDDETAELATFVRSAWGNKAAAVNASQVAAVRKTLPASITKQVAEQDHK
ncbi:c-type cytochrome [Advenella kashmirensis]|uniref:c-type cytochrome n=1 Tax=Advenella kashmirensis TaxID=310575 RepID=UPI00041FC479|nr:cytochrome c [Advenella kashmirensis]